ncbi:zinc dependent phospholipase C family protein [Effusibacillus consociatus]|uniref:Zinc dependent phospholipase C family protein n=1 Tax=Effusibacillus consociatus TaxID=1117041 RepID=A0ABV9PVF8_9BACL
MPNIWTHLIFGQELLRNIGQRELLTKDTSNLFHLGCQGPDFLFYHNFLPWKKDRRVNRLGEAIHHEHCGPFLVEMVRDLQGRPIPDAAVIYVLGFLTHHVLDRNMHPYIHYKSGYVKWNHQRFEVILDTLTAKKFLGIETWKTPVWKQFDVGNHLPPDIVNMFQRIAGKYFPELASRIEAKDWNDAYRDMVRAQRFFHDPTGLKRLLTFGRIEPLVYKRKNSNRDYLNEAHEMWNHPGILEETSTESFWDLWEKALSDGEAVIRETISFLTVSGESDAGVNHDSGLIEKIGNVSYDTGKPCSNRLELRYAKPII